MPTLKQRNAFNKMVESVGGTADLTMGKIMLQAGYSKAMAKNPAKVTESKGWKELLDDISDESLLAELKGLAHDKTDKRAKIQAIDMLLDLKGRYPNQKNEADFIETLKKVQE